MFTNQLPKNNKLFSVNFLQYAKRHFLNNFEKKYKGKQWDYTKISIEQDLSRLRMTNNTTQFSSQIDELNYSEGKWLAKYDFKIALSNTSTKASGNRCIIYIDDSLDKIEILLIYNKTDLPKNTKEKTYIYDTIKTNYSKIYQIFYE